MRMNIASIGFLLASLVGCSQVSVNTAHDSSANFQSNKTYGWDSKTEAANASSGEVKSLGASMIKNRVEKEMNSKGLAKSMEKPDLLVGWKGHSEEVSELNIEAGPHAYGRYGRMHNQSGTIRLDRYKVGTLEIFLIDPAKKQIVWQGSAESVMGSGSVGEKLDEAIAGMFKDFPPKN